ncbi:MAG TPA: phage portal protein [Rhabdochlamydiaceae bacterium]
MSDDNKKEGSAIEKKGMSLTLSESSHMNPLEELQKNQPQLFPLMKALKDATGKAVEHAPALAFMESPNYNDAYAGVVKSKRDEIPDSILKMIRVEDHLVAAILRTRGGQISQFGKKRADRFDKGMEISIKPEFFKLLNSEQFEKVTERIKRLETILLNCGHTEGLENQQKLTLSQFLSVQVQNACTFGWMGSEIIYDRKGQPDKNGAFPFHRFRPIDAGTIYKTVRNGEQAGINTRILALQELERITGEKIKIDYDKLREDRYAWAQQVDGIAKQYFTHEELLMHDFFPTTDVERNGYPVSPIQTAISSITTHISIDTWKRLYFQNGRASRGALVIKSVDVDSPTLEKFRQEFQASINGVQNSFRTPLMGISPDEEIDWLSFQNDKADDSFEFVYDQIARNILATFQMSPDELPGYGHLSKSSNSQTLSESNNEFKMEAARDSGLVPLLQHFETFFNQRLIPIIDPILSKIVVLKFAGLDAESKEQEATRLQQEMPTSLTMDDVLHQVDRDPIGIGMGGEVPFNERIQLVWDRFVDVGQVKGRFFNNPAAFADPMLRFKRDPFALQYLQLLAQTSPNTVMAMFAPNPNTIELLKLNISDMLEEDDE